MRARIATHEDLTEVAAIAHAMKRQVARWSPQYFRPREGAEEMHTRYLEHLIGAPGHRTFVLERDGAVAGFFAIVPQSEHN